MPNYLIGHAFSSSRYVIFDVTVQTLGGQKLKYPGDFPVVDVPAMLALNYYIMGDDRVLRLEAGINQGLTETCYVLAEFLDEKNLLVSDIVIERSSILIIRFSDLNEVGNAFLQIYYENWSSAVDQMGMTEEKKLRLLERRWQKFLGAGSTLQKEAKCSKKS